MARPPRKTAHRSVSSAKAFSGGTKARPVASLSARTPRGVGAPAATARRGSSISDVEKFVQRLARSTPIEIVALEREGVRGSLIKDLSRRLAIPTSRMFGILGVPKATAEKKAAAGEMVTGSGGQAAIGIARLLAIAEDIIAHSTAAEAKGLDAAKWLGQWIERPQPALGGRKPADLVDTPTGIEVVARLLGAIESGAYQ